jgi:hypothetical protein
MIKQSLIVFIGSLVFLSFTGKNDDYIPWNTERKLSWDDFLATAPSNTSDAALTTTYVGFSFSKSRDVINYKIECKFQKSRSWGRVKTEYILKHEQGHFDIAEIFARKLNKEIKEYLAKSNNHEGLNPIYSKLMQEKRDMQTLYDEESNHSINKKKQAEWDEKIAALLEELENFKNYSSPVTGSMKSSPAIRHGY